MCATLRGYAGFASAPGSVSDSDANDSTVSFAGSAYQVIRVETLCGWLNGLMQIRSAVRREEGRSPQVIVRPALSGSDTCAENLCFLQPQP